MLRRQLSAVPGRTLKGPLGARKDIEATVNKVSLSLFVFSVDTSNETSYISVLTIMTHITNAILTSDEARTNDFDSLLSNPILDIAAQSWHADRYEAFRTCYRSMRWIDDLVDKRRATGEAISEEEAEHLEAQMNAWVDDLASGGAADGLAADVQEQILRFQIPLWPWKRLAKAMIYDLRHNGFDTFLTFRRYCEGAAIAPAAVFVHLCGLSSNGHQITDPSFNVVKAARPLALFSYLVHIMRDLKKDQEEGLNYFPDSVLSESSMTSGSLRQRVYDQDADDSYANLIATYLKTAHHYRCRAAVQLREIARHLQPRYRLSLQMVYELYAQIFELIDLEPDGPLTGELGLNGTMIRHRIDMVSSRFARL